MVVITDGNSDDDLRTTHAADRAQAAGVVTFSVGVGHNIGRTELNTIATNPDCTHVYTVNTNIIFIQCGVFTFAYYFLVVVI